MWLVTRSLRLPPEREPCRPSREGGTGGIVSVRLPGLTVVEPCDQQDSTNEGAINQTAVPLGKRYFSAVSLPARIFRKCANHLCYLRIIRNKLQCVGFIGVSTKFRQ